MSAFLDVKNDIPIKTEKYAIKTIKINVAVIEPIYKVNVLNGIRFDTFKGISFQQQVFNKSKNNFMKSHFYLILSLISITLSCTSQENIDPNLNESEIKTTAPIINVEGSTIEARFNVPAGFERIPTEPNSFEAYLRLLPLKADGEDVHYYDGRIKSNNVYAAVIDLEIGERDLHQCADAVMRLRAEYLWHEKKYDQIHFNFTNGFRVDYSKWMQGQRVAFSGNKAYWKTGAPASNNYASFWKYMELIFTYAGTLSLDKELHPKRIDEMKIGDVFIHGGSPGHAVIVVDMAINKTTQEKIFMLAQSYMPAQETQVLLNFNNQEISPWYSVEIGEMLQTPEWTFSKTDLKEF